MARRRKKRSKRLSYLFYTVLGIVAFAILLFIANVIYESGYLHGYKEGYATAKKESKLKRKVKTKKEDKKSSTHKTILSEVEDYKRSLEISPSQEKKKDASQHHSIEKKQGAKLVIIIDDVAYGYQVKKLLSLHMPITFSFFPPSKRHPNTAKYAQNLSHAMVHLPLEAMHYSRHEVDTLKTTTSSQEIERVIRNVRRYFPHVHYINNHTGSKFTSDLEAMRRLIKVLDRYGFIFVDSRTTAATKVPQAVRELGHSYLHRDIFLDNEQNITYIQNQLKKAIHIAQKRGYAIAIGHPHPKTIEALRRSKKLLKKVRLVYIDQL